MAYVNENFKKVIDALAETAQGLGFEAYKNEEGNYITEDDNGVWARFCGEKGVFALNLADEKIALFTGDDAEAPESTPKKLSACLFANDIDERDIKYVISDFNDTIRNTYDKKAVAAKKAQPKTPHTVSKAAVKNGSFYDQNTLASKLCLVYPELRAYYKENLAKYGEFLGEEFFTKYGTKKIIDTIKENNPQSMKKLFQVLNEIYEDGTNDTQSLIAVTILGELNNDQILLARCVDYMSETMAPPVIEVNKYLASAAGKKAKKQLLNPPAYKPKKEKKPGMFAQAMAQSGGGMQPPM